MVLLNKSKVVSLVLFSLILALSLVLSAYAQFSWYGNVSIGANASTNGALIGAYSGSALYDGTPVKVGSAVASGQYQVDVGCNAGNNVFLKVWGINSSVVTCGLGPITGNLTNLSVSLVDLNGACTYTSACSGANVCCPSSGTTQVNDGTTSGATCKATCAAASSSSSSSSSSGGGSGGGGGGGTALGSETKDTGSVSGSATKSLTFEKSSTIAVTNVELSTTSAAAIVNGKVAVKETTVGEAMSSGIATGATQVYKYLSITKQNIKDSDLEKAKISFEVPVSWLNANNIDPNSITLNRYVSSQWVALPTTRIKAVNSRAYLYEAETPGFSTFAIAGKQTEKLTAFQLIDVIRDFYAGKSTYTAFDIIDLIRKFYA